jgi:hypothetical protein
VDFNTLYPSAYGSILNMMIGYTGNKMLMPGNLKEYITDKQRILEIIFAKKELFVVTLKGGIPEDRWNEIINYAPIIRNIEIGNDKSKRKKKKFTQLMITMGLNMSFSSYYLWYLIDRFGFVIDDVTEISLFYANDNGLFTKFIIQLMEERMKGIEQKNDEYGTFCKNSLNAAYGKDGMNQSKYSRLMIMDQDRAFFSQCLPEFKGSRAISNNRHIVEKNYKTYSVNTAIQEAVFTLDNAKFWYNKFVYDFIYKCIDLSKIHFIEGDTDSLYYAISGNPDEDCHQGFKHVVKNEVFCKENLYKWFPNPTLHKEEQTIDKKKLLGVNFEKKAYIMFAIAPKCYILKSSKNDDDQDVKKMKGVSSRLSESIDSDCYKSRLLKSSNPVMGINRGFMVVESDPFTHTRQMVKYVQRKKAINGSALDKMIVLEYRECAPFLPNLTKDNSIFLVFVL